MTEQPEVAPAGTRLGHVSLLVASLPREIEFYTQVIGLRLHWQRNRSAGLGTGQEDLVRLVEKPGASRSRGTTGLYHFALLMPSRRELARVIARLLTLGYPNAPTDHMMTQSTYLSDPEGNGIEIYADTPEEGTWEFQETGFAARDRQGRLRSGRDPLDLNRLFAELPTQEPLHLPLPHSTTIGHIHLHVSTLNDALHFYCQILGFELMGKSEAWGAAFVSAGGYHHHIGLNTWLGIGAPAQPPGTLGLQHFSVVFPDDDVLQRSIARLLAAGFTPAHTEEGGVLVRDPSQNGLLLQSHPDMSRLVT